jgi:predicted phosphate transport protein (TIGR00153 family)
MRLLPREERFFTLFLDQANIITQASERLLEGVRKGNSDLAAAAHDIAAFEQRGDEVIHDIFTRLNQTFITPLDPEDIHSLSSHLDEVLDGIEDAAHRLAAYRVEPIPPAVVELCEIVHTSAQSLARAFEALNKNQRLLEHCIEVNRLEGNADQVLRRAIETLFATEKDAIAIIKLKEIYEFLEQTTDRCEDVADALQNVVVKNS